MIILDNSQWHYYFFHPDDGKINAQWHYFFFLSDDGKLFISESKTTILLLFIKQKCIQIKTQTSRAKSSKNHTPGSTLCENGMYLIHGTVIYNNYLVIHEGLNQFNRLK